MLFLLFLFHLMRMKRQCGNQLTEQRWIDFIGLFSFTFSKLIKQQVGLPKREKFIMNVHRFLR